MCKICSYNGSVFSVEAPLFVELEITDTEPGFKGDTATGATKPATVETGATVSMFRCSLSRARTSQDRYPYRRVSVQSIRSGTEKRTLKTGVP